MDHYDTMTEEELWELGDEEDNRDFLANPSNIGYSMFDYASMSAGELDDLQDAYYNQTFPQ